MKIRVTANTEELNTVRKFFMKYAGDPNVKDISISPNYANNRKGFSNQARVYIDIELKNSEYLFAIEQPLLSNESFYTIDYDKKTLISDSAISSITLMQKIKELRKEKSYTQQDMANALDMSYQAYAHYEKGRRKPDINTLVKLSRLFNVKIEYLLGIQPEKI